MKTVKIISLGLCVLNKESNKNLICLLSDEIVLQSVVSQCEQLAAARDCNVTGMITELKLTYRS